MKVKITLSEWEIKQAIAAKIKEKIQLDLYTDKIQFEGSVKFKKKSIRKSVVRLQAWIDVEKV